MFDPKTIILRVITTVCEKVSAGISILLFFWLVSVIIDPKRSAAISHLPDSLMMALYFITLAMIAASILLGRYLNEGLPPDGDG